MIRVLRRFRLIFNAVKTHFREVEKLAGVAGAQLWALSVIRERPGIGITELARAMDIHQSTASNLARTLIDNKFATARRRGNDRRTVQLHVLAAGAKVLDRAPGPYAGVLPDALSQLDARTLSRIDKDLAALIAVIGVGRKGANVPLGQP